MGCAWILWSGHVDSGWMYVNGHECSHVAYWALLCMMWMKSEARERGRGRVREWVSEWVSEWASEWVTVTVTVTVTVRVRVSVQVLELPNHIVWWWSLVSSFISGLLMKYRWQPNDQKPLAMKAAVIHDWQGQTMFFAHCALNTVLAWYIVFLCQKFDQKTKKIAHRFQIWWFFLY